MKKLFIAVLAFVTFAFSTNAQTEKGTIYLGGQVGFSSGSSKTTTTQGGTSITAEGPKTSSFSLLPSAGYFFSDNMAIGLGLGYNQNQTVTKGTNTETTNTTGIFVVAPHFRYYMPTSAENFKFFVQASVELGFGNRTNEVKSGNTTTTTKSSINQLGVFVSPNFAYFPTKAWAIELGLRGIGYSSTTETQKADTFNNNTEVKQTQNSFVFDVNSLAPTLGVRVFFGKK
jgi:outer membrane protein